MSRSPEVGACGCCLAGHPTARPPAVPAHPHHSRPRPDPLTNPHPPAAGTRWCGPTAPPASCGWAGTKRRCRTRRWHARSTPNTSRCVRGLGSGASASACLPSAAGGAFQGRPSWQAASRQQAGSKRPGLLPTRLPRMRLLSCRAGLHAAHETIPIVPPHRTAPQAWYREGRAAEGLGRWEEAASAYFQASQLQVGSVLAGLGHARLTTPMRCCPAPASAWEGGVCAEPPLHALIL